MSGPLVGRRTATVAALAGAAAFAWFQLGLTPGDLLPAPGRADTARAFLGAALQPALDYESDTVPAGAPPLTLAVIAACLRTIAFAAGGMSVALVGGLVLGVLSSTAWWRLGAAGGRRHRAAPLGLAAARATIAGMRSVHELLWAVLFVIALGASPAAGALAIAIPYAGTLAKVFSELLDEAPADASRALGGIGATGTTRFLVGVVPRALAQMASFTFYQFECAMRSAAVLGFFGYPTIGYHIAASFNVLHFREVWTYLYALIGMIVVLELWSARLRLRRLR